MDEDFGIFDAPIKCWGLVPDGAPIVTRGSRLLPVRHHGAAMLKVAIAAEERAGAALMAWWGGEGAARVLARDADAILLERAEGAGSLVAMAAAGRDDEATRLLCAAAARLHAPRDGSPPDLMPLPRWFRALAPAAARHGGPFARSWQAAEMLLSSPREITVLHGDIHHGNVLDFGPRGWLVIDPKGLVGERGFDYANVFCNPSRDVAVDRFATRLDIVVAEAGLERQRLLQWILAWAGLSAAWDLEDGLPPDCALAIAELAAAELA